MLNPDISSCVGREAFSENAVTSHAGLGQVRVSACFACGSFIVQQYSETISQVLEQSVTCLVWWEGGVSSDSMMALLFLGVLLSEQKETFFFQEELDF